MWFVDALYRDHAEVEDRVKAAKRTGLGLLPSTSWQLSTAWILTATTAADLDAWTRLLLLVDRRQRRQARAIGPRRRLTYLRGL
ncbi:IS1380 family transposase, partial [Streptomyces samsunensis]|nr:IS1380 family transposase [Streptomyces samsunensis]